MLPIALLPIAGLLLGIGSSLTNPAMIAAYHLESVLGPGTVLGSVLSVLSSVGSIIFDNLPILFAMGVALGMAENEKATATLAAAISFFVMHETIHSLLELTGRISDGSLPEGSVADVVGITSLEMGVFGGIVVGLSVITACIVIRATVAVVIVIGTATVIIIIIFMIIVISHILFLFIINLFIGLL